MAISIVSQNGKFQYGIKHYVLDSIEDLEKLQVSDTIGSTAFIIESGKTYILNSQNNWVAVNKSSSASSSDGENIEIITNQQIDDWFDEEDETIETITNQQIDNWFDE